MKGYDDRDQRAEQLYADQVFDDFDATESERTRRDEAVERARKVARLKEQVRSGTYQADIKDIARLLTSAMDPTL